MNSMGMDQLVTVMQQARLDEAKKARLAYSVARRHRIEARRNEPATRRLRGLLRRNPAPVCVTCTDQMG